jgi:hypothetical protein
MGTASTTKVIKNVAGQLTEVAALKTSAGAGDAEALVALNASGILDDTIVNSKNTSAGAGDAGKIPKLNASGILDSTIVNSKTTSAGVGDSGKLAALNASGILDDTIINASATSAANKIAKLDGSGKLALGLMPTGMGPDVVTMTTSEIIASGDLVNIWDSTGAKVRKADATVAGKEAHGFCLVGGASAASVDVYFEGSNTAMTGLVAGKRFLSTTPGLTTATAPSATGNVVQRVGFATSTTAMNFQSGIPVTLV